MSEMNSVDEVMTQYYELLNVIEDCKAFVASNYFDVVKTDDYGKVFRMFGYNLYEDFYKDFRNVLCTKDVKQVIADKIVELYRFGLDSAVRRFDGEMKDIANKIANIRTANLE